MQGWLWFGCALIAIVVILAIFIAFIHRLREPVTGLTCAVLFFKSGDEESARVHELFWAARKELLRETKISLLDCEFYSNQHLAKELGVTEAQVPALVCRFGVKSGKGMLTATSIAPRVGDLQHLIALITSFAAAHAIRNR